MPEDEEARGQLMDIFKKKQLWDLAAQQSVKDLDKSGLKKLLIQLTALQMKLPEDTKDLLR